MKYDERQLVDDIRKGSHQAFQALYNSYKYRVCKFIYNALRSYEETEEVFQAVFEKLWEKREELDPNKSISSYIYTIAKNTVYNLLCKRISRKKYEQLLLADNPEALTSQLTPEDHDLDRYINSLIEKLPPKRKEIFLLRYQGQMSYKDIAKILAISENTIDTQLRLALKFLRENLGKELLLVFLTIFF